MSNRGNTLKVTRRQQPSATTPAALEYDGVDIPVLIRLPDLSASRANQSTPPDPQQTNEEHGRKRQRRKRRFDRSHATGPQHNLGKKQTSNGKWPEQIPKSRIVLGAAVLAVAGIAYFLIPSGNNQEGGSPQLADPWSAGQSEPNAVQVVMPSGDSDMELWPEDAQTGVPQRPLPLNPPQGLDPRQTAAQQWPESGGLSLASPSGHSVPVQGDRLDQLTPVESGTRPMAGQDIQDWPDAPRAPRETTRFIPTQQSTPVLDRTGRPQQIGVPLPSSPYYSTPSYSQDPNHRTGRLPTDGSGGTSGASQEPNATLSGAVTFPRPEATDESRPILR